MFLDPIACCPLQRIDLIVESDGVEEQSPDELGVSKQARAASNMRKQAEFSRRTLRNFSKC